MKITSSSGKDYLVRWEDYARNSASPHVYARGTRKFLFGLITLDVIELVWRGEGHIPDKTWFPIPKDEAAAMGPEETQAYFVRAVDAYEKYNGTATRATPDAWSV